MRLSFGYALAQPLYPSPIHSPNLRRPRLSHGRILFYSRAAAPFTPSGFDRLSNPALVWMIIQVRAHGHATTGLLALDPVQGCCEVQDAHEG
jgi:hypothetical protein